MTSDLSFGIFMFTLFSISMKFSSQYNKILGYKWNSAWRVTGKHGNPWSLSLWQNFALCLSNMT